ncbi:hypothetical protein [Cellulophaga baltica]|uniref:hypothetical protein n=1 Tax=Cellulophaga baltica TaxID=76594 RepID=UPI00040F10D4|nr:hypothetical protein [Cellulophaga baltica]AIY15040.1 hypothetical protein M667_18775 [Cellulophaga baltica NN016038]
MVIPEINAIVVIIQEWNLKKEFNIKNNLLFDLLAALFKDETAVHDTALKLGNVSCLANFTSSM